MMLPRKKREPVCCRYCGRDTTRRCGICNDCLGLDRRVKVERMGRSKADELPLEDDYSEESDADSVCDDQGFVEGRVPL